MCRTVRDEPAKDTHEVRVPYKKDPQATGSNVEWEYKMVPMFWPHEVLQYLFETVGIKVDPAAVQQYWSQAQQNGLQWSNIDADRALPIPLKIFGDDATYNQQGDKVLGFILSCPLWRPRSGRNSRWPIAAISLYGSLGFPTMQPILHEITWSLNTAFDIPLPRLGLHFQVTEIGGDWKYTKEAFCLTTHWNKRTRMCHFCKICRDDFPELKEPLPVRSTRNFILDAVSSITPSPLLLLRKFDVTTLQWCLLHTLHIGLLFTANGGALAFLLEELGMWREPGLDLRVCLRRAHVQFKQWLKRHRIPCSQRPFTVKMLYKESHGAYLSCKGWNSRVVCAWLSEVCRQAWLQSEHPDEELVLLAHAMPLHPVYPYISGMIFGN